MPAPGRLLYPRTHYRVGRLMSEIVIRNASRDEAATIAPLIRLMVTDMASTSKGVADVCQYSLEHGWIGSREKRR
jgi:hypothetical protein